MQGGGKIFITALFLEQFMLYPLVTFAPDV